MLHAPSSSFSHAAWGGDAGGGRSAGITGLGSGPRRKNPLVIILKLLAVLTSAFAGNGRDSEHETEP